MHSRSRAQSNPVFAGMLVALAWSAAAEALSQSPVYQVQNVGRKPSWLSTGMPRVPKTTSSDVYAGDVRITATIDGADQLLIYRDRAEWRHTSDDWPTAVKINGMEWSPKEKQRFDNAAPTAFMPDYTVLVGATHWKIRGRGRVDFEVHPDHLKVTFTDPEPGADKYDVVLHQGEIFPEIEVSEADAKRIAELFANAPQTPHPSGNEHPQRRDLRTVYREWRRSRMTGDYVKFGHRHPKWDDAARAYLEAAVPYPDEPPAEKMIADGEKLIEVGCNDPVVCSIHGYQLARVSRYADAEPFLLHAVLEFEKMNYPRRASRIAPAMLARLYMLQSMDRSEQAYALVQRSLEEVVETVRGPLTGDERRGLLSELRYGVDRQRGGLLADQEPALLRMLVDASDADPWIVHMLLSDYQYRQGWAGRGGDYASTVSAGGWHIFHTLMAQSKAHRVAAWAAYPQFPEGAQGMIMITRAVGGVGAETPRFWFDQAVAAQFDAPDAHAWLMWALRPRWGGSHEEMLSFGMECLRTGRFDSEVPEMFFYAVFGIFGEGGNIQALIKALDADDEIRRGILAIEGSRNGDSRNAAATRNMIFAWLMGWRDEARRRWDELNGKFHAGVERDWGVSGNVVGLDLLHPASSAIEAPLIESSGTLFESRSPIGAMAVSPDGAHVAVRSLSGPPKLTIWNVAAGEPKDIAPAKPMELFSVRFAPDSSCLAGLQYQGGNSIESIAGHVTLWKTGTETTRDLILPDHKIVNSFAWLPEGRYLALGVPNAALIIDSETGKVLASTAVLEKWVTAVGVSPVDRMLAVGFSGGLLQLFRLPAAEDLAEGRHSSELLHLGDMKRHVGQVEHLEFSPDGKSLASSSRPDRSTWIWDTPTREARRRVQGSQIAFSPDGSKLAGAGGPTLPREAVLWDAKTGEALRRCIYDGEGQLVGVAFTPGGEFLIAPTDRGAIYTWKTGE